jgi:hypothetical protein
VQEITVGLWRNLDDGIDKRWDLCKVLKLEKIPYKEHFVCCMPLGNFPASEFYMPTFRNTLFHLHRQVDVE